MLTNNGGFMGTTGNFDAGNMNVSHHLTLTGDSGGGLMRAHDTFQVGSQKISLSGDHYNNLAPTSGAFNPSAASGVAFRSVFGE